MNGSGHDLLKEQLELHIDEHNCIIPKNDKALFHNRVASNFWRPSLSKCLTGEKTALTFTQ